MPGEGRQTGRAGNLIITPRRAIISRLVRANDRPADGVALAVAVALMLHRPASSWGKGGDGVETRQREKPPVYERGHGRVGAPTCVASRRDSEMLWGVCGRTRRFVPATCCTLTSSPRRKNNVAGLKVHSHTLNSSKHMWTSRT